VNSYLAGGLGTGGPGHRTLPSSRGCPSKLCLSRSAKRPDACARLEGYVPALSAARSTATRFLFGGLILCIMTGPPDATQLSSPALRFAIGRATRLPDCADTRSFAKYANEWGHPALKRGIFWSVGGTTKRRTFPKTSSHRREVIGEGRMPSRQPARCRRYLSIASFLSTVLISRLLHRYQQAIER
jgi:hypothetical protein